MRHILDKILTSSLKLVLISYLVVAFFVGIQKYREGVTPAYGTVGTIIKGAAWPITLLVDAIRKQ